VGTRYFSHNPLPLVRYIEIVLSLALVRNFQKFGISSALVRYSATTILSAVGHH
jgi:hypothetical protein